MRRTAVLLVGLLCSAARADGPPRPRLIIVISIDQFRADYLDRFADLYEQPGTEGRVGGFLYLMRNGAHHTDAHHDHYPLFTGPGHAVLVTGAPPCKSGIVGNEWYDRDWGQWRYCVAMKAPDDIGPQTLRVTTIGDELRFAKGKASKLWSIALKDRAAVLMGGHLCDGCVWFDDKAGLWTTSRFYGGGVLPDWIKERRPEAAYRWELGEGAAEAAKRVWAPGNGHANDGCRLGPAFPHDIDRAKLGSDYYRAFAATPFANGFVLDTALEIVKRMELGGDEVTDLLTVNLSSNDYLGHDFGPDSPEVLDMSVRTDACLSKFFSDLRDADRLASTVIVVTADHGVAPNAMAAREAGFHAGTYEDSDYKGRAGSLRKILEALLRGRFGAPPGGSWIAAVEEVNVYLDDTAIAVAKLERRTVEDVVAEEVARQDGILYAFTRWQILHGELPDNDIGRRIARSFHPNVSGDVVFVSEPFWTPKSAEKGATHGAPYTYDTRVPLLLIGPGIRPGTCHERVSLLDLAPTLAQLAGVAQPSGSEGRILAHALLPGAEAVR